MAAEEQNANEGTNPSIRASRRRPTQGDASSKPQHERGERDDGAPRVLREPQDDRNGASEEGDPSIRSPERATQGDASSKPQHERGERDDGAPLNPSIPQDEREGAPDERNGASGQRKSRKGIGGPKTPEGKAVVRRNPIKHGVLAQTPVIPLVEREEDWEELQRDMRESFGLRGATMEALGTRASMLIWRLNRVVRFETEAIENYIEDVPGDWQASRRLEGLETPESPSAADVREMDRMVSARLMPDDSTIDKITRYEARLHRYLLQTLYQITVLLGLKRRGTGHLYGVPEIDPPGAGNRARRQLMPPQKKSFRKELLE